MSPTAALMAALPRLCYSHLCHRTAILNAHFKKTAGLNSFSLRQHGTIVNKSKLGVQRNALALFRHCLNLQTRSSSAGVPTLRYKVDRYQGVHCDLGDIPEHVTVNEFDAVLGGKMVIH
jgi:hypothetical protein